MRLFYQHIDIPLVGLSKFTVTHRMESIRRTILKAAIKRFSHFGFNKTSMAEIASDAGITKTKLYYYYSDKEELEQCVLRFIWKEIIDKQYAVAYNYKNNLMEILDGLLELNANFLKKYYAIFLSQNMKYLKEKRYNEIFYHKASEDLELISYLLKHAVNAGEISLHEELNVVTTNYLRIIRALSLESCISDIITGVPNVENIDSMLTSQKLATKAIFLPKVKKL